MIRAAIVGLGWWGKTLVESMRRRATTIRVRRGHVADAVAEAQTFADAQGFRLAESYEAVARRSRGRRGRARDAALAAHRVRSSRPREAGKHVFCEKPFALTKADAETAVEATRKAGVTLGLGYNRRFHPEMTKLRERIRSGELGDDPPRRSDDDVPERAVPEARRVAREPGGDARAAG